MHDRSDEDAYSRLLGALDYPMLLLTTASSDERAGCLVGFATPCSIEPPRFLACLSQKNRTFEVARDAGAVIVHALASDAQDLAELFGGETGDEVDKFERCAWHSGPEGIPVLDGVPGWFAARVLARWEVGDHDALLLAPTEARLGAEFTPYRTRQGETIEPGHEP